MIEQQLVSRGIRSQRVLDAMRGVPREIFVPPARQADAYADSALNIDCGQTISQPYIVARMTELLELRETDRALEIGTGSGYQTAVLAQLVAHVYSVEWRPQLMIDAGARLQELGLRNVTLRCGDGSLGWPEHAPYDAILVAAGAPALPEELKKQLAPGGRLVIPVGDLDNQELLRVRRTQSGFTQEDALPCRFVPLVGQAGWRE